jgi:hypothetical protein
MDDGPVIYWRDIRSIIPDVNYDSTKTVGSIELCHGTNEDAEPGNIEPLKEYLTYSFICPSRKARRKCEENR